MIQYDGGIVFSDGWFNRHLENLKQLECSFEILFSKFVLFDVCFEMFLMCILSIRYLTRSDTRDRDIGSWKMFRGSVLFFYSLMEFTCVLGCGSKLSFEKKTAWLEYLGPFRSRAGHNRSEYVKRFQTYQHVQKRWGRRGKNMEKWLGGICDETWRQSKSHHLPFSKKVLYLWLWWLISDDFHPRKLTNVP